MSQGKQVLPTYFTPWYLLFQPIRTTRCGPFCQPPSTLGRRGTCARFVPSGVGPVALCCQSSLHHPTRIRQRYHCLHLFHHVITLYQESASATKCGITLHYFQLSAECHSAGCLVIVLSSLSFVENIKALATFSSHTSNRLDMSR